jgi:ribosome-associated toxin RatA of RatAB toxin-antitoxin module
LFTSNTVKIYGEEERVLAELWHLAAELQDWPAFLPHYRYMRISERSKRHKIAAFGATRVFGSGPLSIRWPCGWTARQELFPEERRITYKHVQGITKGMWVEWRWEPCGDHVRVTIDHTLNYPFPLLGPLFAEHIVGKLFVHSIAGKTLQCIKTRIETE